MCGEQQHTVSTPGSQGVAGGNRRVATTNEFEGLSALSLHSGLSRLSARPIDVRNVEKDDVDPSICAIFERHKKSSSVTFFSSSTPERRQRSRLSKCT